MNEIAGFVFRYFIFSDSVGFRGGDLEGGGEGVAPATVRREELLDGGADRGEDVRVFRQDFEDGLIDEWPEFGFERGVIGVGGDEDDFVILGKFGEALSMEGFAARKADLRPASGRKLDPV